MVNLKDEILEAALGHAIEAVVIGHFDGYDYFDDEPNPRNADIPIGQLLSWDEAALLLDYEYNNGYGAADCHPIYAWTRAAVLVISIYDGATEVRAIPRHPTAVKPYFVGGGC